MNLKGRQVISLRSQLEQIMGKAKEHLSRALSSHLNIIHETFQVLDQTPASSLEKVGWDEVITMAEQISKQATIAGMLWTGEKPDLKELEENMKVYFNLLQGFLLLSHGSMVDAGPTLCSNIQASVKQVVDSSFQLMKGAVSSYGSHDKDSKQLIPQLAGTVWEACKSLKKTPTTNHIAIGRAITQVAVSLKDVLRELKELKPGSGDLTNETLDEAGTDTDTLGQLCDDDDDGSSGGDIGNDLSPEEMLIAQSAVDVVSSALLVIKELIRFITGLLKESNRNNSKQPVDSLEKLLTLCQGIGRQVDELGASLYPPQEIPIMKVSVGNISSGVDEMRTEVHGLQGTSEGFFQACEFLESSIKKFQSKLLQSDATNLIAEVQNLEVSV